MARYHVRRLELIEEWMERCGPEECKAMHAWVGALMVDPFLIRHGAVYHSSGRTLHYAKVPGTLAVVSYLVFDVPVRVVTISSVLDVYD